MKRLVLVTALAATLVAAAAHAQSCPTINVGPNTLPDPTFNQPYSQLLSATGGTFPYTFGLQSGSFPNGLRISNDRLVGTPTAAGTYPFTIQAVDSNGCRGSRSYTMKVVDPNATGCQTLTISPGSIPPGNVGDLYTAKFVAIGAASTNYTITLQGSAPPGLGFVNKILTGYPTTPGVFSFDLIATDSNQCTGTQHYDLTIVAAGCPTAIPAVFSPAGGATVDSPVTFSWTAVNGAIRYDVLASNDGGATFSVVASTPDASTTTATAALAGGSWVALVRTTFSASCTTQSAPTRFTVNTPPQCGVGTVTPSSPASGATVSSPVTFSWSAVGGATAYRIWLALDNGAFSNLGRYTGTSATIAVPNGAAEWYVEALFDTCPSIVSSHSRFTVQRSANCGSAAPAPVSPINTDTTSPVTFKWSSAQGASAYRVWSSLEGDAYVDDGFTTDTQLHQNLAPGSYSWYVEAIYSGCPSVASPTVNFRIPNTVATCSGQAATPIAPGNGVSTPSPVTFTWSAVDGATEYRVFASINGGDVQLVGKSDDTTLTKTIPAGAVTWFVEATFQGCAATHSATSRFTVPQAANCPKDKPQLLSPANNAGNIPSPTAFSWSAVSGALRYIVVVKSARGAATVIADTAATQIQRDMPAGTIEWWVIALGAGCNGVTSDHSTFDVPTPSGCTSKRPHPLAPADDAVGVGSPVHFAWTKSANAKSYKLFAALDGDEPALVGTTTSNEITVPLPAGSTRWFVEAVFDSCPALFSALSNVTVASASAGCNAPVRPVAQAVAQALSGTDFTVRWTGVLNASVYELQESNFANFANATTTTVNGVSATFNHTATTKPVTYFYRVRAVSDCSDDRSAFSRAAATRIIPPNTNTSHERPTADLSTETPIVTTIDIAPQFTGAQFTAATNRPWMTVTPPSGTVPSTGQTLTVTSQPTGMIPGSNQGAVKLNFTSTSSSGRLETNSSTPATVPISVSLVTPVAPDTTATPLPNSLIIPAIAHGPGANASLFQSDIRLANVSSQAMKYLINFTPTATDGTQTGTTTTIQVDPGGSTALNDILSSFFGTSADGSASGMLEIRPLSDNSTSSLFSSVPSNLFATVASSRTYNVTSAGTFGQFIPAIPFSQFVGKGSILSLQQIAQSAAYRTNFGLVEASGQPANVILHVYDKSGSRLADISESLLPSEHLALNGLLAANNITLDDGRVEVEVISPTGKVSAYASVLDNRTNDPLLVSPVLKGSISSSRYVIPGVAYTNTIANWRTDARLYNSGLSAVNATLTFYPQVGSANMTPIVRTTSIQSGETKQLDNILNATFGVNDANAGGSVLVTTTSNSNIIASARTYAAVDNGGTIGQFVPAVTPADSVGAGDRSLQLLQLESSDGFRTNIGIAETSGNAATAEVSLVLPDSKLTPVITVSLAANQFTQLPLSSFGLPNPLYNARVSVRVTSGSGRVTAYGSLIDNVSQDPTYVPAQ